MNNIVRLINLVLGSDHTRNCEGRTYSCTCGYDIRVIETAERAHAEVTAIKASSRPSIEREAASPETPISR